MTFVWCWRAPERCPQVCGMLPRVASPAAAAAPGSDVAPPPMKRSGSKTKDSSEARPDHWATFTGRRSFAEDVSTSHADGGARPTTPLSKHGDLLVPLRTQQQQRHTQRQSEKRSSNRSKWKPKASKLKPRRRRRRQRTEVQNDLFTSFTLNRDPQNSKYLPYDGTADRPNDSPLEQRYAHPRPHERSRNHKPARHVFEST